MGKSLQEQLLGSGLTTQDKLRSTKTQKRKQVKQQRKNNIEVTDEAKLLAQQAKAEQIAKDKALNQQKQQQQQEKAIVAQIKQLIHVNKVAQDAEGEAYNFSDANKVKKIYISEKTRELISKGSLAIIKFAENYDIVPSQVAEKIAQRDPECVLVLNDSTSKPQTTTAEDDPYSDYQIPDDLMW